ncbi:hypothetical protein Plec18170_003198 [Paecilomyces lecythidis]
MSEHQDTSNPNAAVPAPVAQQPSATPQQQPAQQSQQQQQAPVDQSTANVAAQAQAQAQAAAAAAIGVSNAQNGNAAARSSSSGEDLACHWQGCSERCPTAEILYEHVCEKHVGRKSTNNLNLTCQWGSCRTTTVKRDHITSHIRVHVPLKPHKCEFCGKAFKRPQDLKKHVKTHADDSVLVRSPEPGSRNPDVVFGVPGNPKGFPTGGHYFEPAINAMPPQGYSHGAPQYYHSQQPPQPSNPSYGNVYYTLSQGPDAGHSYESKKRGYEALNEFFGDLKRRQFDPSSYAAVSQRLLNLHGLQLPLINPAVPEYQHVPAAVAVGSPAGGGYSPGGAMPSHGYHLPPMGNARTKNDLLNLDQFLEQMQTTIYDNDNNVAASGVGQPGAHYVQGNMSYRTTNSPPTQLPSSHATATTTSAPGMSSATAHSPSTGTPALTPPSSAQSYTPGRSPIHRVSPPGNETGSSMYPRLPSTTASDSMSAGYPSTTSAAPASTLGGIFDHDDRRRYGGNNLQRARPDSAQAMDVSMDDLARTPPAKEHRQPSPEGISSSLIDPALHRSSSPDAEAALRAAQAAQAAEAVSEDVEAKDRAEEQWVEHIRLIENLRKYISDRLERGDFDDSGKSTPTPHEGQMEGVESASAAETPAEAPAKTEPGASLYPTLRGLDDGDSKMTGDDN